jgi:hypothetical protein
MMPINYSKSCFKCGRFGTSGAEVIDRWPTDYKNHNHPERFMHDRACPVEPDEVGTVRRIAELENRVVELYSMVATLAEQLRAGGNEEHAAEQPKPLMELIDEALVVQAQIVASEHQGADHRQRAAMRRKRDTLRAEIEQRIAELEAK